MSITTSGRRTLATLGENLLAALEPLASAFAWRCIQASGRREDRRANEVAGPSWYLDPAARARKGGAR